MKKLLGRLRGRLQKPRSKGDAELAFWKGRYEAEAGTLSNDQFEDYFCGRFGLDHGFYEGKRVLDIGCGPRGSLEWAHMAAARVGLDPLVDQYRDLGIDRHAMEYVQADAEAMPFPDGSFDVVSTMNSLDHVDDLTATVAEIGRVCRQDGTWLLVVECGAESTPTEPQTVPWTFVDELDGWEAEQSARVALNDAHDIYKSWHAGERWTDGPGLLIARLTRI